MSSERILQLEKQIKQNHTLYLEAREISLLHHDTVGSLIKNKRDFIFSNGVPPLLAKEIFDVTLKDEIAKQQAAFNDLLRLGDERVALELELEQIKGN